MQFPNKANLNKNDINNSITNKRNFTQRENQYKYSYSEESDDMDEKEFDSVFSVTKNNAKLSKVKEDIIESDIEDNKQYENIINKNIFCFWTGDNPMSDIRKSCLEQLNSVSQCNVVLVTKSNLSDYILDEHPLHPSWRGL